MEASGIATGIGFAGGIVGTPDAAATGRRTARRWNEFGARLCYDHGVRFGLFASLPLADVEGSLREMEYAFTSLNADGLGGVPPRGSRRKWGKARQKANGRRM